LPAVRARVREVAAGSELIAVHGGAAFTRTLVCEEVRLVHGRTAILVDGELDPLTTVLSGRTDLVAIR
jgi:salicyloyl-CoA 5-hydroxylase